MNIIYIYVICTYISVDMRFIHHRFISTSPLHYIYIYMYISKLIHIHNKDMDMQILMCIYIYMYEYIAYAHPLNIDNTYPNLQGAHRV